MTLRWHVAQAVRNRELAAALSVTQWGMNAYVPSIKRQCKRGFQIVEEVVPRFGVYVFVQFDRDVDPWGKLVSDHVSRRRYFERVLCNADGVPSAVPARAMDAIRAYVPPSEEALMPHVYQPGEAVLCFVAGIRMQAVFVGYQGNNRQFVRTWIFGRESIVEVSTAELEPLNLDNGMALAASAGD